MELTLPVAAAVLGAALLHAAWNALVKGSADKQLDTFAGNELAGVVLPPAAILAAATLGALLQAREPIGRGDGLGVGDDCHALRPALSGPFA